MALDKDQKKTIEKLCLKIVGDYKDASEAFDGASELGKELKAFAKASKDLDAFCNGLDYGARKHAAKFLDSKSNAQMLLTLITLKGGKKWDSELKQVAKIYGQMF
ncbi:MAG: hypothetical protein QGG09_06730 [Pirellulaceae bacterium]|jgi:hypothetical protein|nr:hypothetical protein [Pirellulaceae bacterium]HJN12271.1 hypothetical protein [Pirellulaceae bacterium]